MPLIRLGPPVVISRRDAQLPYIQVLNAGVQIPLTALFK